MGEEKEKIGKLVEKVDELLVILSRVAEDLKQVSGSLKSLAVSEISKPTAAPAQVGPEIPRKETSIEDIKMMFPEELENLLSFEEKEDYVKVKPRQFLGSDNFAKIASIVRGIDGDYVSAGKQSHFRIPKGRR
jgi:hypothetical protein